MLQSKFNQYTANLLAAEMTRYVRPEVQYITVTQRFQGLYITNTVLFKPIFANVLTLAAGGNGHVPIPLLAQVRPLSSDPPREPASYRYALSFAGKAHHGAMREPMLNMTRSSALGQSGRFTSGMFKSDAEWLALMSDTAFQMAPRGVGPTSFRLFEVLQRGWTPVYIQGDSPWLPYYDDPAVGDRRPPGVPPPAPPGTGIWSEIAHIVHHESWLPWLTTTLPALEADAMGYLRMRGAAAEARDKYFTFEAVLRHIRRFIDRPTASQLRCVLKPL